MLTACESSAISLIQYLQQQGDEPTQSTNSIAPNFRFTTFDGQEYALSDFRGQVVVVNFWASWCAPCQTEVSILETLWHSYRDQDVTFIGLAYLDFDPQSIVFIEEYDLIYINGADGEMNIAEAYNVLGIPETFVIDRHGNIVNHITEPLTEQMLGTILDQILLLP